MGEGIALHGGADHCNCYQPRPQPLPEICPGVHTERPRLPARSAVCKFLRNTLKHSKAALVSGPGLHQSMAKLRETDRGCFLLPADGPPPEHRPHRSTFPGSVQKTSQAFPKGVC